MVYDQNPLHVPPHPLGIPCISPICDWQLIIVKLTVLVMQGDEADYVSTRFWWSY